MAFASPNPITDEYSLRKYGYISGRIPGYNYRFCLPYTRFVDYDRITSDIT